MLHTKCFCYIGRTHGISSQLNGSNDAEGGCSDRCSRLTISLCQETKPEKEKKEKMKMNKIVKMGQPMEMLLRGSDI